MTDRLWRYLEITALQDETVRMEVYSDGRGIGTMILRWPDGLVRQFNRAGTAFVEVVRENNLPPRWRDW